MYARYSKHTQDIQHISKVFKKHIRHLWSIQSSINKIVNDNTDGRLMWHTPKKKITLNKHRRMALIKMKGDINDEINNINGFKCWKLQTPSVKIILLSNIISLDTETKVWNNFICATGGIINAVPFKCLATTQTWTFPAELTKCRNLFITFSKPVATTFI